MKELEKITLPEFVRIYRVEFSDEVINKQIEERKKKPINSWIVSAMKNNPIGINQERASGRYFGDSLEEIKWYIYNEYFNGYKITYLDIPKNEIEKYRVSNIPLKNGGKDVADNPQAFSLRPEKEFYVTLELSEKRQEYLTRTNKIDGDLK